MMGYLKVGIIASRPRFRNLKHVVLVLLAIPLLVIASVSGLLFLPAFWGLRWLAEIEYEDDKPGPLDDYSDEFEVGG